MSDSDKILKIASILVNNSEISTYEIPCYEVPKIILSEIHKSLCNDLVSYMFTYRKEFKLFSLYSDNVNIWYNGKPLIYENPPVGYWNISKFWKDIP